jgi:hypothetical protein
MNVSDVFGRLDEIPPEIRTVIEENDLPVVPHEIDLGYDYWSAGDPTLPVKCLNVRVQRC